METAPRNCRFLSLVVVELVLIRGVPSVIPANLEGVLSGAPHDRRRKFVTKINADLIP